MGSNIHGCLAALLRMINAQINNNRLTSGSLGQKHRQKGGVRIEGAIQAYEKSEEAIMSVPEGTAAIREAIEARRSKIKTPGVSLKTLERDASRKKAW